MKKVRLPQEGVEMKEIGLERLTETGCSGRCFLD